MAARAFGELRQIAAAARCAAPSWPTIHRRRAVESRDRAQTALAVLFPGPPRDDPDRYSAAMIASVASGLGGRFFDELRDKRSLCYTVHAFASERRLGRTFGAYIATSPQQEDAARDGLLAEFRRLREEPVTAEELERAQTLRDRHARDSPAERRGGVGRHGRCVSVRNAGGARGATTRSVRAVTAESMRGVAERYFDPSRRVEGIVRGRA